MTIKKAPKEPARFRVQLGRAVSYGGEILSPKDKITVTADVLAEWGVTFKNGVISDLGEDVVDAQEV